MKYIKMCKPFRSEDDVGGQAKVTKNEERELRGASTKVRLWRRDTELAFDAFSDFEPVQKA